MDLSIVERLTCPNEHDPTPLVARADSVNGRDLRAGVLGCPLCRQEWRVTDGIAQFGPRAALADGPEIDANVAAAMLGLTERERLVVVDGVAPTLIDALSDEYGALVIALDAVAPGSAAAAIDGATALPMSANLHGALLLRDARGEHLVTSVVRALHPGGRFVAARELQRPAGIRSLAEDAAFYVGEKESISAPIELRRSDRR